MISTMLYNGAVNWRLFLILFLFLAIPQRHGKKHRKPLEKTAKNIGILPDNFSWVKKYRSKIITLPSAQGDVPLFLDRLSWAQISELLFRWSFSGGKVTLFRKISRSIFNIRSWGDIKKYSISSYVFVKLNFKKFFKKK